jgi:spore coat polysaccharide biosynthesis protein SpsF
VKSAILITARLKSTRLPRKVLKPILGRPMLCHLIERLRTARLPDEIILCTSTVAQDDPLEELAREEGVRCYRGHPDDVLVRLTEAARRYGAEAVISCTGDNPFVDPLYVDRLLEYHLAGGYDFTVVDGLPFGANSYGVSVPAMVRACGIKDATDTEFWGGYLSETGLFRTGTLRVTDPAVRRPELRLTVDTPEDFQVASRIIEALHDEARIFRLEEIVRLCDSDPSLTRINAHVRQKPAVPIRLKAGRSRDEDG